jgi:hypoxia up-regulated 1
MLIWYRLAAFDSSDKSRRIREEVLNSLEAFTYRARDYLEDDSFIGASTSAVRDTLEKTLSAASDWMYSGGADADEKTLRSKLKELEDIVNPVMKRKDEASKRPDAIKELKDTIAHIKEVEQLVDSQIKTQSAESSKSSEAVSKASAEASASPSTDPMDDLDEEADAPAAPEITEVPTIYTEVDLKIVREHAEKAQVWLDENETKQAKLGPTDDPVMTVKDIMAEKKKLDDVVMDMMMKKMKHFKPPNQSSSKPKTAKAKKTAKPKKASKTKKAPDTKETEKPSSGDANQGPSQAELEEALRKAGVSAEGIKLSNLGSKTDGDGEGDVTDEKGRLLKKLDIGADATEQDIKAAIDRLVGEQGVRKDKDEL